MTSAYVPHETDDTLPGRSWLAADGVVTVLAERTPGGMYLCLRPCGWKQGIRASIIRGALERSEIKPESVEAIAARSAEAAAADLLDPR